MKHIELQIANNINSSFTPDLKKAESKEGSGEKWITVHGKHILIGGDGEIKAGNIGQKKSNYSVAGEQTDKEEQQANEGRKNNPQDYGSNKKFAKTTSGVKVEITKVDNAGN